MIEHLIHGWEDLAVIAACFVMAYAYPYKSHRYKKVQSTESERNQDDHSTR